MWLGVSFILMSRESLILIIKVSNKMFKKRIYLNQSLKIINIRNKIRNKQGQKLYLIRFSNQIEIIQDF